MRALVTGAGGFVGHYLQRHLEDQGDEVVASDRSDGGPDLLDADGWTGLLADVRPEVVYHLAGDADVGGSWRHPRDTFAANAVGTLNLLLAARDADVRRVLNVGSADVYGRVGPDRLPIREDHPLEPVSPYAASQDRRRLPRPAGHARLGPRGHPGAGVQPHRPRPVRPLRGAGDRDPHRPQRASTAATRCRSAT